MKGYPRPWTVTIEHLSGFGGAGGEVLLQGRSASACFCRVGTSAGWGQCPHLERLLVTRQDPDNTGSVSPAQVGAPRDGHSDSSGHVRTQVADSPGVCVWLSSHRGQEEAGFRVGNASRAVPLTSSGLDRSIRPSEP